MSKPKIEIVVEHTHYEQYPVIEQDNGEYKVDYNTIYDSYDHPDIVFLVMEDGENQADFYNYEEAKEFAEELRDRADKIEETKQLMRQIKGE